MAEYYNQGFIISTDATRLNIDTIYDFITRSYWAKTRSRASVICSLENSLCFGLYDQDKQVGIARVVTDYATFAWLCDVFIDEGYRGKGLGKWLVSVILSNPELKGVRRWLLITRDAHGLYRRFGFSEIENAGEWMGRFDPLAT